MADRAVVKSTLSLVAEFHDGDTRTITLDNPKNGLTAEDILDTTDGAKEVLIGDKTGAPFLRWASAKKISATTTYLDLSE